MHLSVVVPMYNEEAVISQFADQLRPILDGLAQEYEVVFVDDGSRDSSLEIVRSMAAGWPQVIVVQLRRNAGHQEAITAGLERATGRWVVTMDADLQDPPELIPEMLTAAGGTGCDIVYAVRTDRSSDSAFKRLTADLYYRVMNRTVGAPVPRHAGDFRLMRRTAVAELLALPESRRVYRLLIPYMGFRSTTVEYLRAARVAGSTKYSLPRMIRLAADSYFSFTTAPLRLATWLGAVAFVVSVTLAILAFFGARSGTTIPGWASLVIVGGLAAAVQFMFLGLIGEYLARIYTELLRRPRYFVEMRPSDRREPGTPSSSGSAQADSGPSGERTD